MVCRTKCNHSTSFRIPIGNNTPTFRSTSSCISYPNESVNAQIFRLNNITTPKMSISNIFNQKIIHPIKTLVETNKNILDDKIKKITKKKTSNNHTSSGEINVMTAAKLPMSQLYQGTHTKVQPMFKEFPVRQNTKIISHTRVKVDHNTRISKLHKSVISEHKKKHCHKKRKYILRSIVGSKSLLRKTYHHRSSRGLSPSGLIHKASPHHTKRKKRLTRKN